MPAPLPTVRHWESPRPPRGEPDTLEDDVHAALLAAEEAEAAAALPPAVVGLIAFGALVALLLVTYAFRNAGHRNQ